MPAGDKKVKDSESHNDKWFLIDCIPAQRQ